MLGSVRKNAEQHQVLDRVAAWTRRRFDLADDAAVLVSELACGIPGCPPLETVIAFWSVDGTRHHFKIFKPVQDIVDDDLPFAWLKDALAVPDDFECSCC